jgi:tetratricopeptide (TPR) repeat protein
MRRVPVEPCWRYPDQRQEADDGIWRQPAGFGCILLGSWLTTMAKPGRNDPCPCGSGNKYKKCCLAKEEAAEREELAKLEARRAEGAAARRLHLQEARAAMLAGFAAEDDEEDELTIASNAPVDLVRAGKLDEAEQAARDLLVRFPEVHDGYDRLGMVYEARGDHKQAAYYYQKVIDFIREHPDQYEPEFETVFRKLVERLDPSNPT